MRKFFYVIIMVIMAACVKPLDTLDFINEMLEGSISLDESIIFNSIEDRVPELQDIDEKDITLNEKIEIDRSKYEVAVIQVINFDYFEDINWYCNSTTPLSSPHVIAEGRLFIANSGKAPFNVSRTLQVTVEGKNIEDNKRYGTFFNIEIK